MNRGVFCSLAVGGLRCVVWLWCIGGVGAVPREFVLL